MSTRELYIGGAATGNYPGLAIFPSPAFSATDPAILALSAASQKGDVGFGLTRVLDFYNEKSLKTYLTAQAAAGTPIAAADVLGAALLPPNALLFGLHVVVENPQPGLILTPSTRIGGLTFPAIDCSAASLGQFAAPGASSWSTGTAKEVVSVTVTTPGSGYTTAPTVSFSGGAGTGAAAYATLVGAGLSGISVANAGAGYTSAPSVSIVPAYGDSGTGATATATVSGGVITAFTVTAAGSGYTKPPTVLVSGGGGTGGAGTAAVTASAVATVTVTNLGSGYTSAPTVAFAGGGGTLAAATAVLSAGSGSGISAATFNNAPDIINLTVTALGANGFGNLRLTITPLLMKFARGQY